MRRSPILIEWWDTLPLSPDQQVPDAAGDVKGRGFAEQGHHLQEKIKEIDKS